MKITQVKVKNYRNIDGAAVSLNPDCAYVIGENALGKTNFLALLATLGAGRGWEDDDFFDVERPIEVALTAVLGPGERGFSGGPAPAEGRTVHLDCRQTIDQSYPTVKDPDTGHRLPIKQLRRLHFQSFRTDDSDSGLSVRDVAENHILDQIRRLARSRGTPFDRQLVTAEGGRRILPLVLAIDEPEAHLHPYQQRALIGYYKRVLAGRDAGFVARIRDEFGIDGVEGQLIVVTHSADALVGDHRNLVRFYRHEGRTAVISGADPALRFTAADEKHLVMHFPEIKEAFYARCVILVEGETEYGCLSAFADKLGILLDDHGICVINARGEGTIRPLRRLLSAFAIPSVAIYDGDVRDKRAAARGEFFTETPCFESEVVWRLTEAGRADVVQAAARELDDRGTEATLTADALRKSFKKMGADAGAYTPARLSQTDYAADPQAFRLLYAAWFMTKKGVILGRIIGSLIPAGAIPACYAEAIRQARAVSGEG